MEGSLPEEITASTQPDGFADHQISDESLGWGGDSQETHGISISFNPRLATVSLYPGCQITHLGHGEIPPVDRWVIYLTYPGYSHYLN